MYIASIEFIKFQYDTSRLGGIELDSKFCDDIRVCYTQTSKIDLIVKK